MAAAVAVLAGMQAASAPAPPARTVLTAARDLPAGAVLGRGDLAAASYAPSNVPGGAVTDAGAIVGRTTTGPLRAGEPITDVRLLSGSLLEAFPGRVAVPVRIADRGAVELLRIGDRVDVIAADPQGASAPSLVASAAPVVALPDAQDASLASGGLVVLAVHEETARELAGAAVSTYLSVALTR